MDKPLTPSSPALRVDPAWLSLRRDFDRARRDCSTAFAELIRAVEDDGDLAAAFEHWRVACARHAAVDEGIERYVQAQLGAPGA